MRGEMSDGASCRGAPLRRSASVFGKLLNSDQSRMSPFQHNLRIKSRWPFKLALKSVNGIKIRRETSGADQIYVLFSC